MNIIATIKPWNINFFKNHIKKLPGQWVLISEKKDLNLKKIRKLDPDKIFFIHWSWIVSKKILKNFNCISFHMTDLPKGRGGSPLQNLILRKKFFTKVTAFKMTSLLDYGPIYYKKNLSLKGSALEIYNRSVKICYDLIGLIIKHNPKGNTPKLKKIEFKRLNYKDNEIKLNNNNKISEIYDKIRMVDAPTYKKAYIKINQFFIELSNAEIKKGILKATCKIKKIY